MSKPVQQVSFKVSEKTPETVKNVHPFNIKYLSSFDKIAGGQIIKSGCIDGSHPSFDNSFIGSVFKAYCNHHNLTIRPDDVWIAIAVQFAAYMQNTDKNESQKTIAEELRSKLVDFEGKKELEIKFGGSLETVNWDEFVERMNEKIEENIKDPSIREWIVPNFTTTTDMDRMCGGIVLMSSLQSYFDYKMSLCCGIPEVTIQGTLDDWMNVRRRIERLLEFETTRGYMAKWTEFLFSVIDNIIESVKGKPNVEWWEKICHHESGGSGPSYLSGWITVFSVFSTTPTEIGKWQVRTVDNCTRQQKNMLSYISNKLGFSNDKNSYPILDTNDVSCGYATVPLTINDNGDVFKTMMFAGHLAIGISDDNHGVYPKIGWFVARVDENAIKKNNDKFNW